MAHSKSYAEAAGGRTSPRAAQLPDNLPGSAYRSSNATSNASPHRVDSPVTTQDAILVTSAASTRQPGRNSATLFPDSHAPHALSLTPRRPSIAQVLSRPWSMVSHLSDSPSTSSYPVADPPLTPGFEIPLSSKTHKKRKNRRRKKTSQNHGDFLASRGRSKGTREGFPGYHSPLLTAISKGDIERVQKLIADPSHFPGDDTPDNRPLQAAALAGHEGIVKMLIETGKLKIDARDSRERTAVFAATSRGHESIVEILLSKNAKPLSREEGRIANKELNLWKAYEAQLNLQASSHRSSETFECAEVTSEPEEDEDSLSIKIPTSNSSHEGDHLYKLEIGSCENIKEMEEVANMKRQDAQAKGEWVKGPIQASPMRSSISHKGMKEIPILHKPTRYPGFGFEVSVVEFDFSENGGHCLVSPAPNIDDLLYGTKSVDKLTNVSGVATQSPCRWYHLPANNLGWAEDLIKKIYETRSVSEQRKRDVILRREPFANGEHDHMNPTMLDPRPQARALRPICRNMTLDRDGTQRLSTAFALHMPYIHWETEISRAEMAHVMEEVRQGRKDEISDASLTAIPDIKIIQNHHDWTKNEKLLVAYLYNSPPVHPRRTLDQFYYHMLEDTEERDKDQVITRYYHNEWKKKHHVPEDDDEYEFAMPSEQESKFKFSLNSPSNFEQPDVATRTSPTSPAHPQSTEEPPAVGPTEVSNMNRPDSQHELVESDDKRHVIMVDQLWLWILDENTIITSFPQNWTHDADGHTSENDPMDVLKSIYRYLALVNRPPLESIFDLAQLIVYKSLATFCKKSTPYGPMQILDVYESAIASVTDKETKIFNSFATNSKAKKNDRQTFDSHEISEELYNIDEEIEQLKEIKDIQDELHILSVLLENQTSVLKQAADAIEKPEQLENNARSPVSPGTGAKDDEARQAPYSASNNFHKLHGMILEQEKRRKGLEVQAEQANKALNHLLDLKQKQANVSEARSARWTAESTKQQGNIMVLFTLVTIIFAPLTLIVTIFQLRVIEFPITLHMRFVLKYMFGISVAVIVPLLGLVIYTTRLTIAKLFMRLDVGLMRRRWLKKRQWARKKRTWKEWWEGDRREWGSGGSQTDLITKKPGRNRWWTRPWGKMNDKGSHGDDTEKGKVNGTVEINDRT